jgi:hypothetical protein
MIGLAIGPGVIAVLASAIHRNAIITFAALALVVLTSSVSGHARTGAASGARPTGLMARPRAGRFISGACRCCPARSPRRGSPLPGTRTG